MADFEAAVEKLLDIEGGFSPRDNANGAVNLGITSYFLKLIGRPHSVDDVRALTPEVAKAIYRAYFWEKFNVGKLLAQRIAEALLICLVNTNPQDVIFALQESLADIGHPLMGRKVPKGSRILGLVTVGTINCLTSAERDELMVTFKRRMSAHYESLAASNPAEFADDAAGWKNRMETL